MRVVRNVRTGDPSLPSGDRDLPAPRIDDRQAAIGAAAKVTGAGPALGWLPVLTVVAAGGLILMAIAYSGSRAGADWAQALFWIALLVLFVPIAWRLVSAQPRRAERIGLVLFLGLGLYLVKVMQNPVAFTFPDELTHLYNVDQVLQTGRLFQPNPLLPVTSLYPGLAATTEALSSITGLSNFVAGVLLIGAARFILLLVLYLFYEQVSGSARIAGIAALLYMANANFVFFSAEYAYESLSLPLAFMVALAVIRRERAATPALRFGLTAMALLGVLAVVITHHLTAYALVAFLLGLSVLSLILSRGKQFGPWGLALFALAAVLGWVGLVAGFTVTYLTPTMGGALSAVLGLLTGATTLRELFRSPSGQLAPLWEQLVGIGSVILLLLGLPFGLREIWRSGASRATSEEKLGETEGAAEPPTPLRRNPFALLLAGSALIYLAMPPLRLFPSAWELANRAAEYLYLGVAFVLALAVVWFSTRRAGRIIRVVTQLGVIAAISILFAGGLIAGWSPNARLARPYLVSSSASSVEPPGVAAAEWARSYLGTNNRIATDPSNAHLLLAYGDQYPLTGDQHGIRPMLQTPYFDQTAINILSSTKIRYVLLDRRMISWDQLVGIYFERPGTEQTEEWKWFDPPVYNKFDAPFEVSRILDGGTIVIYDVGLMSGVLAIP